MKNRVGFTLVELLVIVALLAFLMAMSTITFNRVRQQSRDSMRAVHITQIQTALKGYYRDNLKYPTQLVTGQPIAAGPTTYIESVPTNPQPVDGACPQATGYAYTQDASGASYHIIFCLGNPISDYQRGFNTATPAGVFK